MADKMGYQSDHWSAEPESPSIAGSNPALPATADAKAVHSAQPYMEKPRAENTRRFRGGQDEQLTKRNIAMEAEKDKPEDVIRRLFEKLDVAIDARNDAVHVTDEIERDRQIHLADNRIAVLQNRLAWARATWSRDHERVTDDMFDVAAGGAAI